MTILNMAVAAILKKRFLIFEELFFIIFAFIASVSSLDIFHTNLIIPFIYPKVKRFYKKGVNVNIYLKFKRYVDFFGNM